MWPILVNILYEFGKNVYSAVIGWSATDRCLLGLLFIVAFLPSGPIRYSKLKLKSPTILLNFPLQFIKALLHVFWCSMDRYICL